MQHPSPSGSAHCLTNRLLALAAFALLASAACLAAAPDATAAETEAYWQRSWKNIARRVVKIRDDYYSLAAFDSTYPSSKGVTTVGLRQKTAKEVTEQKSNLKIKKYLVRPNEDVDVEAKSIPEISIGQYGHIHSAEILDILGPDEMIVANIWLVSPDDLTAERTKEQERLLKLGIDKQDVKEILEWVFQSRDLHLEKHRDRQFRQAIKLKGFSTLGLAKGERFTGKDKTTPQIAIVATEMIEPKNTRSKKPIPMLLAIPAENFMRPITDEKEFLAYLGAKNYTKESFVLLVQEERKVNGTDEKLADAHIYNKLEGRTEEKTPDTTTKPKSTKDKKPSF